MASVSHDEAIIRRLRKNPDFAAEHLKAALEDDDEPRVLLITLRHLAQAQGIAKVAKAVGIDRESLYRALSVHGNPRLWFGQDRKQETLDEFFRTQLRESQRKRIEAACVDMWRPLCVQKGWSVQWESDPPRQKSGPRSLDSREEGIGAEILLRISREFGKSIEWILTGEG
jgi:probable addiction module antidote protein